MELNGLSLAEAIQGLRKRSFSAAELASACLAAIQKQDGDLHAYLDVFDDVQEQAKRADALLRDQPNTQTPLCGIPLAMKDNLLIEGRRCTAGSRMLEHYIAPYNATVITKLKQQNIVFLGKTNMDEFAMGSSTEHSAFGPTKNPHDLTRVPGGSSGGSAVAVAANLCTAALGSDTGGSIRQPASFCGIVGLKPTYGAVSRHGLIAMASSLDQIGPMTKTVADAEILFHAIAGHDPLDATSAPSDAQNTDPDKPLAKIRIGMPVEYFSEGLDADVKDRMMLILKQCVRAGAVIQEIHLPHTQYALPAYYIIVPSEVSANLARFDGIRYGAQPQGANTLFEIYTKSRAQGFGPEVKRRIMLGTYALSAGYYDAYYTQAQKVRRLVSNDFSDAFRQVDMLIGPTTPTPAFPIGDNDQDPLKMYLADIYTVAVNLAGIPAISLPAGTVTRESKALPVGLQIMAPRFCDWRLFSLGKQIEAIIKNC